MTKKADLLMEALRDTKLIARAVASRSEKSQKHRYERRKARESLRGSDWSEGASPA